MEEFGKNYENRTQKALNAVDRAGSRIQIGCWTVAANLFFAGFCLWGIYVGYTSWKLDNEGVTTMGTVVRLDESTDSDGGCCTYSPVIEFEADGQTYSFKGNNASYPPAYEVGEQVSILYHPADPNTAQINKWTERWLFPILIIPAMTIASLIFTYFMARTWRRGESFIE